MGKFMSINRLGKKLFLMQALDWLNEQGIQWRMTSYMRDSPNHQTGYAMDVAPFKKKPIWYAGNNMHDPLLPQRYKLMKALLKVSVSGPRGVIFFVETDHIHMQVGIDSRLPLVIVRWPSPKDDCYIAASEEMDHPRLFNRGSEVVTPSKMDQIWAPFTGKYIHPLDGKVRDLTTDQLLAAIKKY